MEWILMLPCGLSVVGVVFNLITWRKPRQTDQVPGFSVLIPARNEARGVEDCVRGALANHPERVVVYDDSSEDGTAGLAEAAGAEVVHGRKLPQGWFGKAHALDCLSRHVGSEWLVFVDADTILEPRGVARLLTAARASGADLISAVPKQRMETPVERWVLPLLHLTYLAWLPMVLISRTKSPKVVAANGQLMAVRRESLLKIDGFRRVRAKVVDDMAICEEAKRSGLVVDFVDGTELATTRMYEGAAEVWAGFSKNVAAGLGGWMGVSAATALYAAAFVWPFVAVALLPTGFTSPLPTLLGLGALLLARVAIATRFRHRVLDAWSQPLGVLILIAIAWNSWRWQMQGVVRWRGRTLTAARS